MANLCAIHFALTFANTASAESFFTFLDATIENENEFLIGGDKYIEIACKNHQENAVTFNGNVPWMINDEEIIEFMKFINEQPEYELTQMLCHFEELGCTHFGFFAYSSIWNALSKTYLPDEIILKPSTRQTSPPVRSLIN